MNAKFSEKDPSGSDTNGSPYDRRGGTRLRPVFDSRQEERGEDA
jgi:hypothetical protein